MGVCGDSAAGEGGDDEGEGEAGGIDEDVRCVPVHATHGGGRRGGRGGNCEGMKNTGMRDEG